LCNTDLHEHVEDGLAAPVAVRGLCGGCISALAGVELICVAGVESMHTMNVAAVVSCSACSAVLCALCCAVKPDCLTVQTRLLAVRVVKVPVDGWPWPGCIMHGIIVIIMHANGLMVQSHLLHIVVCCSVRQLLEVTVYDSSLRLLPEHWRLCEGVLLGMMCCLLIIIKLPN
jgi:hypothetical protein